MERKDYKAIGEIIKNIDFYQLDGLRLKPDEIIRVKRTIVKELADYFEGEADGITKIGSDNIIHKFNRSRFLNDCGMK